jgi:translation initiation factor RLI1
MSNTELSSIVYVPSYLEQFQKLDSGDLLAQLHSKFWGTGMAENEQVRGVARGVGQQSTSNLSKGEDDGKEDDEEREDDGKTGFVLEIDNNAIYMDKIFVRVSEFTSGKNSTFLTTLVGRIHPDL